MDIIDEAIEEHLESLGYTLFGKAFDITRAEGREKARAWLRPHYEAISRSVDQALSI